MWYNLLQGKGKYIVTVHCHSHSSDKNSVRIHLSLLYPVCQKSHHNLKKSSNNENCNGNEVYSPSCLTPFLVSSFTSQQPSNQPSNCEIYRVVIPPLPSLCLSISFPPFLFSQSLNELMDLRLFDFCSTVQVLSQLRTKLFFQNC